MSDTVPDVAPTSCGGGVTPYHQVYLPHRPRRHHKTKVVLALNPTPFVFEAESGDGVLRSVLLGDGKPSLWLTLASFGLGEYRRGLRACFRKREMGRLGNVLLAKCS